MRASTRCWQHGSDGCERGWRVVCLWIQMPSRCLPSASVSPVSDEPRPVVAAPAVAVGAGRLEATPSSGRRRSTAVGGHDMVGGVCPVRAARELELAHGARGEEGGAVAAVLGVVASTLRRRTASGLVLGLAPRAATAGGRLTARASANAEAGSRDGAHVRRPGRAARGAPASQGGLPRQRGGGPRPRRSSPGGRPGQSPRGRPR